MQTFFLSLRETAADASTGRASKAGGLSIDYFNSYSSGVALALLISSISTSS